MPEDDEDKWTFAVGAYLQAAHISGVATVGDMEVPTEVSFDQLIDKLQGAFSVHFEGLSASNVGLAFDYLYAAEEPWSGELPRDLSSAMGRLMQRLATENLSKAEGVDRPL